MSNINDKIRQIAKETEPELIRIRRELHQYPELGIDLPKTHEIISRELHKIPGLKIREHVAGGYGLIAELKGKKEHGKNVLLRADIDALPLEEKVESTYKSRHDGRMHACGHDGHATWLIGAAKILAQLTDEFGGCPENRARFTKLVVEEVRKQVGPMFPIFVRISADELMEGGNTLEDTLELLSYFQEEVDAFDVSAGLNGSLQFQIDANYLKDGWRSYMAKAVREKYNKPCVTMGNIRDPRVADDILERGDADIIGMGRGLIADPHWVKKVATGHEDDIRKCISCNIGCAGNRIGVNRPIRCTVNPTVNSGFDYKKKKVNKPCNVVVIGGGTAGLEAACTAAEVGCTTFLFEKNDHLGGLAVEISKIPDKKRLRDFPDYLVHRASKLTNLFIFKGQEATLPLIKALHPNIIVNSTGSNPLLPPIKGLHDHIDKEGSKVASITGMINHLADYPEDCTGKKVVVVGGGAVGLDVVEYFAPKGAQVSIVEMMPQIGKDLDPVSKCGTNTLMREHNVNQMTETALCEVKADAFTVKANGEEKDLPFDYGFVCLGMRANAPVLDEIREAFADTNVEIINIGDSVRARRIIDGVQEGHNILNVLADHEYL